MIKKFALSIVLTFVLHVISGQVSVYNETMGTSGSNGSAISVHESNNRFDEIGLTYSGSGDMRATSPSSGYATASGVFNVMLNSVGENFVIDGIDVGAYSNITVSFGIRKSTNASDGSGLILEYSTGGTAGPFTQISYPLLPTGSGTAIWHYRTSTSVIPNNITTLRFRSTNNVLWRIDDLLIEGVASTDDVDWANVQSPANGTIDLGNSFNVYAQAWETGVTDSPGQGAGITAWIGYSTSNTDPSGTGWTWVAATYNTDSGNNDEYVADIGAAIPTIGTYYYASRFQLNSGPYRYGGFNAGFWDGTTNVNGVLTINPRTPDWVNLQFPGGSNSIALGNVFDVFGQIYEPGVTDTPGAQGANIQAWIGYSTANSDPSGTGWTWVAASYNPACGTNCGTPENNDEYFVDIGSSLPTGTYYYASRFTIDDPATFYYGGYSAAGGGFWDGTTNVNGQLVVTGPASCSELFISEYIEGSSNNKYIEIYNPTASTITLTGNYSLEIYANGSNTASTTIALIGSIAADDVFVIENSGEALGVAADQSVGNLNFNGDDAVALVQSGTLIDVIGQIGVDPGTEWSGSTCTIGTADGTLVRNNFVQVGDANGSDAFDPDTEWTCYSVNTVSGLGSHSSSCTACTPTHSVTGFAPTSGPENTEVTISGTGFTASTTVTFNGQSATIVSWSATQIVVLVPNGASSGVITVTESSCDVQTSADFTVIDIANTNCQGSVVTSDLIISEVTDATSGSLTYIEIYNGTGAAVSLSNYKIEIQYNASSSTQSHVLTGGSLANGDIYVVRIGASPFCSVPGGDGSYADEIAYDSAFPSNIISGVNSSSGSSDCIKLLDSGTDALIDVWGDCSDADWRTTLGAAIGDEGFDFRRLTTATPLPSTSFSLSDWNIIDWTDGTGTSTCPENDYTDIDNYYSGTPPTNVSDPLYSGCGLSAVLSVGNPLEGFSGGNSLAYQWYYHMPGNANWTEILASNSNFAGQQSNQLTVLDVIAYADYQFYCQVREDDVSCYQASNAVKLDVQKTVWNGASWDNGLPNTSIIAVIDGNYNTSLGNIDTCSLYISSGTLNVLNSNYVRVVNDVINNSTLTVQTHAAFVQDGVGSAAGTFTNNGTTQVIKLTELLNNWYEYTFWGSPVVNETVDGAFPNTPANWRFWFNASNYLDQFAETGNNNAAVPGQDDIDDDGNDWQVIAGTSNLTPGLGYAMTSSPAGLFPGTDIATFDGALNTGDINTTIVINGFAMDNDWNLIGNPYASAIDFDDVYAANSTLIDGAAFLWSHASPPDSGNNGNEALNFNQSDYAIITVGSGNTAGGSGVIPAAGNFIPSGQGFFVKGLTNGTLTFNNSMRRADTSSNDQFFDHEELGDHRNNINSNRLWVNLTSDNGVFNQILTAYVDGATNGFDGWSYDAPRNLSSGAHSIIYTLIPEQDKKFAIQGKHPENLNLDEVIPIGFYTSIAEPTLYEFAIAQFEGDFLDQNDIYLKDNYVNSIHNLKESNYNFTSDVGEFNDRFEIVFSLDPLSINDVESDVNTLQIIELNNGDVKFKLNGPHRMKTIEIIDLLGRTIYYLDAEDRVEKVFSLNQLSQATYLAKVELSNGYIITKKAIKQK